jgi:hypothetical protein
MPSVATDTVIPPTPTFEAAHLHQVWCPLHVVALQRIESVVIGSPVISNEHQSGTPIERRSSSDSNPSNGSWHAISAVGMVTVFRLLLTCER